MMASMALHSSICHRRSSSVGLNFQAKKRPLNAGWLCEPQSHPTTSLRPSRTVMPFRRRRGSVRFSPVSARCDTQPDIHQFRLNTTAVAEHAFAWKLWGAFHLDERATGSQSIRILCYTFLFPSNTPSPRIVYRRCRLPIETSFSNGSIHGAWSMIAPGLLVPPWLVSQPCLIVEAMVDSTV